MRITVVGQRGNGPVLQRTVTLRGFIDGWGRFAPFLWDNARHQTLVIEGHKMRVIVH